MGGGGLLSFIFFKIYKWRFSIGTTYLALAIVPPRPLVTQTNKTARTYHRGAVSDLGLDTAVFLELDQVVERIPWPCAGEGRRDTEGEEEKTVGQVWGRHGGERMTKTRNYNNNHPDQFDSGSAVMSN